MESVLHIGVDFTSVVTKNELLEILKDLFVLISDDMLGVTVEELLLISPQGRGSKACLTAETAVCGPDNYASAKDGKHNELNPPEKKSH